MINWNSSRLGLSLLEVMIAVSILAIISALMIPRIGANKQRSFDKTSEEIGDLLMMFGMRTREGRTRSGIYLDPETSSLELLRLNRSNSNNEDSWAKDPFVNPISLKQSPNDNPIEVIFYEDQSPINISIWPLSVAPGEQLPSIEVVIRQADLENRLIMPSHALAPVLIRQNQILQEKDDSYLQPIDLDAEGRSREDW